MNYIAIILLLFIASCTTTKEVIPQDPIYLDKKLVQASGFSITTFQKITNLKEPFVFYIEGDGLAFLGKYRISQDPTPRRQMLIKLAQMDQRPNVVYIARPCQYTPMELNPKCNASYWTSKRMSEESVEAINEVINKINNSQKFSLIGYSGGGAIAVLVAARNHNVRDIITIAANLDHKLFTDHHKVTPMNESLNPIDYAKSINYIPQLHISGGSDKIIPPFIAKHYVKISNSDCVKQRTFEGVTHKEGWNKIWDELYRTQITCNPN